MTPQLPPVEEKFHLNSVRISGIVQRILASGTDVLLRLSVHDGERVTLLLPNSSLDGQPLTLMKGDWLAVTGYLVEMPYLETGRQFLERLGREDLLADVPGLAQVVDKRMATCVVVQSLQIGEAIPTNEVVVEGIVARTWEKGEQRFARLAIYDRHTETDGEGRRGRPRRKAHYISLHFPDGLVNGRKVVLSPRDHLRATGRLCEQRYSESLGYFLMRAGGIGLLAEAPNSDSLRELRTQRVATYVVIESMLQFTK
jgi:hypothetical protein